MDGVGGVGWGGGGGGVTGEWDGMGGGGGEGEEGGGCVFAHRESASMETAVEVPCVLGARG